MALRFSETNVRFSDLSPLSNHPLEMEGETYRSVFHYFAAKKFAGDKEVEEWIEKLPPMVLFNKVLGRESTDAKWDKNRDDVLREALRAKYFQHPETRKILLMTGWTDLEYQSNDPYWGLGKDKTGENRLGDMLEEMRAEIRAEGPDKESQEWAQPRMEKRREELAAHKARIEEDEDLPDEEKKFFIAHIEKSLSE